MCRPRRIAIGTIVAGALVWALKKKSVCEKCKRTRKSIENSWQPGQRASPLRPQDPFLEQPFGQYAPTVARMAVRTIRIFIVCFDSFADGDQ